METARIVQAEPTVSVVVPVYNKAPFLRECLDSILAQSIESIEVLCVDDGSTDDSWQIISEIARRDPRLKPLRNAENRGPGPARNAGIEVASGRFLQFTDADDTLPPDALRLLVESAAADEVDVVRGMVACFDANPEELVVETPFAARHRIRPFDDAWQRLPWWHVSYLFSRKHVFDHGLRYPDLLDGEDPVFLASALASVSVMSMIDVVTYRYRVLPFNSKRRTTYRHIRDFVEHARRVRAIYSGDLAECWAGTYRKVARDVIEWQLPLCVLSVEERTAIERTVTDLFADE